MAQITSEPLRINYYISGHGYGHATRSAQIVQALLAENPSTQITVITTAPQHLFAHSERLKFVVRAVDSAIVQPQPYTIDAIASFANLRDFLITTDTAKWQTETALLLEETDCNLIIADAPCPATWDSGRAVKSVLISNFSFDAIFEELLKYLRPSAWTTNILLSTKLREIYASYDYVFRLPGSIDFPFVERYWSAKKKENNIFNSQLVFRPAKRGRADVLNALGIAEEDHGLKKILLVQFGGQVVSGSSEVQPQLPKDWICLSASAAINNPDFVTFPPDIYSPDLVEAADVILGKIGYGTVSECVGMNRPLIYVLRPMFAEEPGLLEYMQDNGTCEEISVDDYEAGRWSQVIDRIHKKHGNEKDGRPCIAEGSASVAAMIHSIAARED